MAAVAPIRVLASTAHFRIFSAPVTSFGMNQYAVVCRRTQEAALVDAGDSDPQRWISAIAPATIGSVLLTHGHVDHVAGCAETHSALPKARLYLHPDDKLVYRESRGGIAAGCFRVFTSRVGLLNREPMPCPHGALLCHVCGHCCYWKWSAVWWTTALSVKRRDNGTGTAGR